MSKRILSIVLMLTLVLGSFSMAFADHADTALTPEQKVEKLQELGYIEGHEDGELRLDEEISRAQTAVITAKALYAGGDKDMDQVKAEIEKLNYKSSFKDVAQTNWANPYINVAAQKEVIHGFPDNTFKPAREVQYREVITMMVGLIGEEPNAGKYPGNYITKAMELGLLDGLDIADYEDNATRQDVFVMLFNAVTDNKVGNYNIDKVLVLENNRLESIDADQIVVEVIKEVQRANFADDSRKGEERRGDQIRITLPKEANFDAEDLVGKVVDLSYDKTNKAVAAKEDKTYEYRVGEIELKEKDIVVDGRTYTVLKDERYKGDDERIFRTYINNESFKYENAYKDTYNEDSKKAELDFGRVTIKNGKVLFIDAFAFDDIAPVKEVEEKGKKTELTLYNDINDGGTKRVELEKQKVISVDKDGHFARIDKSDIDELDVVHVSEDNKGNVKAVVVRQDAQVNGKYEKVVEYKNETVVVLDEEEYEILPVDAKRPVYAYDSKDFRTLYAKEASDVLKEFKGEKSTALLDVNGNLQYLGSEIEFGEFVGVIERLVNGARILKSDNTTVDLKATLDSDLGNTTGHQNLGDYNIGDLVYVSSDSKGEAIDVMRDLDGTAVSYGKADLTRDKLGSARILDRTNVFVEREDGTYFATNIKHVVDNINSDDFKAHIVTDEDYSKLNPTPRRVLGKSATVAHTIVFKDIDLKADLNKEKVEVEYIANGYESIKVKDVNGKTETYSIAKDSKAYRTLRDGKVEAGDIIELGKDKDEAKKLVREIKVLINKNEVASDLKLVSGVVESYNSRYGEIKLEGNSSSYFLLRDSANFVRNLQKGKNVTLSVVDGTTDVVAIVEGIVVEEEVLKGIVTSINDLGTALLVDTSTTPFVIDDATILKDSTGTLALGRTQIFTIENGKVTGGKLSEGDQITTDGNVITLVKTAAQLSAEKQVKDGKITNQDGLDLLLAGATSASPKTVKDLEINVDGFTGNVNVQYLNVTGTLKIVGDVDVRDVNLDDSTINILEINGVVQ